MAPLSLTTAERSAILAGIISDTAIPLQTLDLTGITQGWGWATAGHWVGEPGRALKIAEQTFPCGVGTHAPSTWEIILDGRGRRFIALVGVDTNNIHHGGKPGEGSIIFEAWGDGRLLAATPVLRGGQEAVDFAVNVEGVERLVLKVGDAGDGSHLDHAAWAGAFLEVLPGTPVLTAPAKPSEADFDPIAPAPCRLSTGAPELYPPAIVGGSPNADFVHLIGAAGARPLRYSATGLPPGLSLHPDTGVISGKLAFTGETTAEITVENAVGRVTGPLRFVAGKNKLSLTPPMGWNSWNCWGMALNRDKVLAAADGLLTSGLAAAGYHYVNIDDGWQSRKREPDATLQPHAQFGAIAPLADLVHARGMRLGIYSSPGRITCGGMPGSLGHEATDARTWAGWGIDYLKHDWCGYAEVTGPEPTREQSIHPYAHMRRELGATGRDIVYSLCQYGVQNVWEWGADPAVGANLWRTAYDITDHWSSVLMQAEVCLALDKHAGPGHWNDPDMLVVGHVGWGPNLHPTGLTRAEQISHVSMWVMLAAPLLIGCDLTKLDDFTIDVLGNPEVLAINQDPLGVAARRVENPSRVISRIPAAPHGTVRSIGLPSGTDVWSRPLENGDLAVALINNTAARADIPVSWAELGLDRVPGRVRDLWRRIDLPVEPSGIMLSIAPHGTTLLRIG
jgi:alpha-galactosidase